MTDVNQLITEHLDVWASAIEKKSSAGRGNGGAVSLYGIKKLRELILELAVRGQLVPQYGTDEPADALLEKLNHQQADMFARGLIKKPKPLAKITGDDTPFVIPSGWEWCRISQLGHDWGQKVPDNKFTYIDVGSIDKELGLVSEPTVLGASKAPSRARKLVRQGTVIYSTVRPYLLNIAVVTEDFEPEPIASTAFAIVHPFEGVLADYLYRYLRSPTFISYVEGCQTGIAYPAINDKQFFSGLVPLPPTAEQQRIVAKVDELMRLCDALERQAEDSLKAHQTLVETCLATLTNSQTPEELTQNWTRIEAHFDTLFTTEESVDQLLEAVVSLAVQGRLSEQSSADNPFGSYWNEIRSTKNSLASKLGARKKKPIPEIDLHLAPFAVPEAWEWVRLDDVVDIAGGITKGRKLSGRKTFQFPYLRVANVQRGYLDLEEIKEIALPLEEVEKYQLQSGDLLITEGGDWDKVGRTAVWRCELDVMGHQNHVFRARKLISEQIEDWFELYLNSAFARDYFAGSSKQTTNLASINMTQLRSCMVPMPPIDEQKRILAQVKSFRRLAARLKQRISASARVQSSIADIFTSKFTEETCV